MEKTPGDSTPTSENLDSLERTSMTSFSWQGGQSTNSGSTPGSMPPSSDGGDTACSSPRAEQEEKKDKTVRRTAVPEVKVRRPPDGMRGGPRACGGDPRGAVLFAPPSGTGRYGGSRGGLSPRNIYDGAHPARRTHGRT